LSINLSAKYVNEAKSPCRYYFEMSHLIPNLKCHIERVSSLYFREVIAMKKCQISGVELDRLKILSYYGLHLSYRQALDVKKIEEVVSGGKTGEMEACRGPSLKA